MNVQKKNVNLNMYVYGGNFYKFYNDDKPLATI